MAKQKAIHPEVKAIYEKHYGLGDPVGIDRSFLDDISEHIRILERIMGRNHDAHDKTE